MNRLRKIYLEISNHGELVGVVFILVGIIAFNKQFAYIGISGIYITEFVAFLLVIFLVIKYVLLVVEVGMDRKSIYAFLDNFWPLIIISAFALISLYASRGYGILAIRHSMIFFYTPLFLILFSLAINDAKQLERILVRWIIVFSPLFNGTKLIIYKYLGYTFHFEEQERVLHNETDIICASLSLLGLLVYRRYFWNRSQVLTVCLWFLNLLIIFLAVKRSAIAGIAPAVGVYLLFTVDKSNYKKIFKGGIYVLIGMVSALLAWYLLNNESFLSVMDYALNKLSFNERNASWRWEAWRIAFDKFLQRPYLGIGYGEPILSYPLQGTDTHDPHNSLLAFLVRHGMLVTAIYVYFIANTYRLLIRYIKSQPRGDSNFYIGLFSALGLTTMLFFALFNVVLENQYEGIFFHLFLSCTYILLRPHWLSLGANFIKINRRVTTSLLLIVGIFLIVAMNWRESDRLNIYSMDTNSSLPIPYGGAFKNIEVASTKDIGIAIRLIDYYEASQPSLSWFFPHQALGYSFDKYVVVVEYSGANDVIGCELEYEDGHTARLPSTEKEGKIVAHLRGTSTQHLNAKVKLFTLNFSRFETLTITNIYLSKDGAK